MKKTPLLNAALSELVASLGHMDMVVIGDAGLPIPAETRCIALALTRGIPGFVDTLRVVTPSGHAARVGAPQTGHPK